MATATPAIVVDVAPAPRWGVLSLLFSMFPSPAAADLEAATELAVAEPAELPEPDSPECYICMSRASFAPS